MGKLAGDIVIGFLALSVLLILISLFLPWGGASSTNPTGITNAKYYLLSIIVEPMMQLSPQLTQLLHSNGNEITCPWQNDVNKKCYKFTTMEALMAASAWYCWF